MTIRIVRNSDGNCITFEGTSSPAYWNACLSAEVDATYPSKVNIINDIATAQSGTTVYEFYQIDYTEFSDADNVAFGTAADAAAYITAQGNVSLVPSNPVYQGVWNADTNTPTLTSSTHAGIAGDFYIVTEGGATSIDGTNLWRRGDRIIWNGTTWDKVSSTTIVDANTRTVLLNSDQTVFADGEFATADPGGAAGWYYRNTAGNKINWYFYGDTPTTDYTLGDFGGAYFVVDIKTVGAMPYWTVYTKPTGTGDASWYKSRLNYVDEAGSAALAAGKYLFHTAGFDVTGIEPTLPRLTLPTGGPNNAGPQAAGEELWLMALSTSSGYPEGTNEFTIEKVGIKLGAYINAYDLASVPTLPPAYSTYYRGAFSGTANFPATGHLDEWLIETVEDKMYVWDVEGGTWVKTGTEAVAPTAAVNDYPYQYVYSSFDGSGYGFENAYPEGNWINTPDGKLQSTGGSGDILSRQIKFATLKTPGDEVTFQCSNNTSAYYRYGFFGLVPGTDNSTLSWKVAGQPANGVTWMVSDSADYALIEFQMSYMEPYFGGTTYGYNLTGRRNSTGIGYTGNAGELPVTFRVADDYRIEVFIDGHYHVRTEVVPASGVDIYYHAYGQTGRILDQPTGSGSNIQGGTAPTASGAHYYMSDAVPSRVEANILASGNGYWLYSDTEPSGLGYNVELSDNEASQARWSRVFIDYTGMTLQERADATLPIVTADETGLDRVEFLARGYFHSLDMTVEEIGAKMALFGPALNAATAGSVEVCLAQLQALTLPVSGGGEVLDFNPYYSGYRAGGTSDTRANIPTSSQTRADYGITGLRFWGQGTSLGQMEFYFDSNNQPNAALDWASQSRTITFNVPGSAEGFEGTFTLDPSEVVYQSGSQVTYSNPDGGNWNHVDVEAMAEWATSEGLASGLATVAFEVPAPTSPALALGEGDVVNELISILQEHLQKFPR